MASGLFSWGPEMVENRLIQEQTVRNIISFIDDHPNREGLRNTPARVVKSWEELFAGYNKNPADLMTVFSETNGYDEIVVLRNIEFYSTCEHHMLPFTGRAHVAYLPNNRVVGISKLARLLDLYARRLQIQERIGQQVIEALDTHLHPKGSACILVAKHQCMVCRGVQKQNSEMVTSSLSGVFKETPAVRAELLSLIGEV